MKKLALFCSGSGSNAQKIMERFAHHPDIQVSLLLSNKSEAYALERAKSFGVPTRTFNRQEFSQSDILIRELQTQGIDWIILAGFLWLIPGHFLSAYPKRIINIHPALLPKYGGKGMYGMHVHEAVVQNKEKESGITIHYADAHYDEGQIIFQASCAVDPNDTAEQVAQKVHELEYAHYPRVIEELVASKNP